jgi:hypothetical protein
MVLCIPKMPYILAIRYGLQKHFAASRGFDILNNKQDFPSSNAMFSAVLVELKRSGKGTVQHKEPLSTEEFDKLYSSHQIDTTNPEGLQNKVFDRLLVHLCNRGR